MYIQNNKWTSEQNLPYLSSNRRSRRIIFTSFSLWSIVVSQVKSIQTHSASYLFASSHKPLCTLTHKTSHWLSSFSELTLQDSHIIQSWKHKIFIQVWQKKRTKRSFFPSFKTTLSFLKALFFLGFLVTLFWIRSKKEPCFYFILYGILSQL